MASLKSSVKMIGHDEPDTVLDAGPGCIEAAVVDEVGVDLDAHGTAARLLCGLDDDAPVAGAEVVEDVVLSHAGL